MTLNSHKAPVKWFKGDQEIEADYSKYEMDKDIVGVCTLKIKNATMADLGKYSCKITGRVLNPKDSKTKTEIVIKGRKITCLVVLCLFNLFYFNHIISN